MKHAIIQSKVVQNVIVCEPSMAHHFNAIACPDDVGPGWLFDGENFSKPPRWPSLEAGKTQVLSDLAARRYQAETAGVTVAGVKVATDRESQASLTGAYTSLQAGLVTTIDWKGDDGWVVLDLPTCEALAQAVANHVQQCFTREKVLAEQVDAAQSVEDLEVININSGWPE